MTVPVHRRGENKLQAYKDTVAMTSYTLQMCENQKIFPKKCRWTICTKLIDYCLDSIIKAHLNYGNTYRAIKEINNMIYKGDLNMITFDYFNIV